MRAWYCRGAEDWTVGWRTKGMNGRWQTGFHRETHVATLGLPLESGILPQSANETTFGRLVCEPAWNILLARSSQPSWSHIIHFLSIKIYAPPPWQFSFQGFESPRWCLPATFDICLIVTLCCRNSCTMWSAQTYFDGERCPQAGEGKWWTFEGLWRPGRAWCWPSIGICVIQSLSSSIESIFWQQFPRISSEQVVVSSKFIEDQFLSCFFLLETIHHDTVQ